MIETADIVAERYNVSREYQDEFGLRSQQLIHEAQQAGKFDDEIVPMTTTMGMQNKETGEITHHEVTVDKDECNRPGTTIEGLSGPAARCAKAAMSPQATPASFQMVPPPSS